MGPEGFHAFKKRVFVETGTLGGDGIQKALDAGFEEIYSIDIDPGHIQFVRERFNQQKNIHLEVKDSSYQLWDVIQDIQEPVVFWLDAHNGWPKPNVKNTPLMEELDQIKRHPIKTHTLLIDDLHCCNTLFFDFLGLEEIISKVLEINPAYEIRFVPGGDEGEYPNNILVASIPDPIPEKVVICTICRDASPYLPEMMAQVESLGSLFQDYRVVVYENNSEDDTPSQLYRWKRANPKVDLLVEFLPDSEFEKKIVNRSHNRFSRTEQRALARNKALSMALSRLGQEFTYILWIDADVKLEGMSELLDTFQKKDLWEAVFAYRKDEDGDFHDWDAFRDAVFPFGPELMGDAWYTETREPPFPESDAWHPVYSAFGGFAIYKRSLLEKYKYSALIGNALEASTKEWFFLGLAQHQPSIYSYLQRLKEISPHIYIDSPRQDLPEVLEEQCGVSISNEPILVWRMHGTGYQYPEVSEHVSLHASMYRDGHHRFFINPRLLTVERDSHYEFRPNQD